MKKIIKISIIAISAIAILVSVILMNYIGGKEITEGTYRIKGYKSYPNAYIEVKGNTVQFHNIDLNAIYREYQLESYKKVLESNTEVSITEEELEQISDLNELLVENPYEVDYDTDSKSGTFTYIYFCYANGYPFGVVLKYDSFHKTLKINNAVQKIVFEK